MSRTLSENQIARIFSGANIFTRDVIRRGQIKDIVYELASGRGILGTGVWGVSVRYIDGSHPSEKSDMYGELFYSLPAAEDYIKQLRVKQLLEP